MKRLLTLLLLYFFFQTAQAQSIYDTTYRAGNGVLESFVRKDFKSINALVDSFYRDHYTALVLEKDWAELTGTYGEYVSARPVNFEVNPHYRFIAFKIKFEYLPYVFNISFNEKGKIIYISFMPAHKIYVAPDYCDVSKFTERSFTVTNGFYELPGILSVPKGNQRSPVAIFLVEAGPTDKDGSYEENKPYKDIAWALASNGIATFRYEKRSNNFGIYMAKDKAAYMSFTPREDLIDDLYRVIDSLKTVPDIDPERIYIIGHGQGGMLAPLVAKERDEVKGIVMLGANAKKTQAMMIDQYAYLSKVSPEKKAEYEEQSKKALRSMDKKLNPLTEHHLMPYNVQASYWLWLNNYDHTGIAKKLKKPILLLHGERDYQTNMENLSLWQQLLGKNKNVEIHSYPKLNHLFYPGEAQSTYSEYYQINNIPEYVIKDMINWFSSQ